MVHPGFTYPDNICFLLLVAYIGGMQKVRFSLLADINLTSVNFVAEADINGVVFIKTWCKTHVKLIS